MASTPDETPDTERHATPGTTPDATPQAPPEPPPPETQANDPGTAESRTATQDKPGSRASTKARRTAPKPTEPIQPTQDGTETPTARPNRHESREAWLRAATDELRPYFDTQGYKLPELIRFAIAFTSTGRKGKIPGECWHAQTSDDRHFEIIIRADFADPLQVLGVLAHELVHAALPITAGHGRLYKAAATKIGLQGPMRHAMPGPLLQRHLEEVAESIGPLPHARLNIERGPTDRGPVDRPKKQGTRLLKATCGDAACEYTARITAKWVKELGPPGCPKHGPMSVELPPDDEDGGAAPEQSEPSAQAVG